MLVDVAVIMYNILEQIIPVEYLIYNLIFMVFLLVLLILVVVFCVSIQIFQFPEMRQ